jgi:hypothetical protein
MSIRKTIAGLALVGAMTVGAGATAFAQTDPSTSSPPFPNHPNVTCADAVHWAADAQARLDALKARLDAVKARRDRLVAEGHVARAKLLTDRIQIIQARIDFAQDKLSLLEKGIRDHCGDDSQGDQDSQSTPAAT